MRKRITKDMKLISWNVNGIRAIEKKGFLDWVSRESPDVLCLQETKAHPDQLNDNLINPDGYETHWAAASERVHPQGCHGLGSLPRRD